MSIRNLFYFLLIALIFTGCSRTFAPSGWLPDTDDIPADVYGGWMTLTVAESSSEAKEQLYEYRGEFLSSDENYVYLLADSTYIVPKIKVRSALLELDQKGTGTYVLWGLAFLLTPAVNGWYSSITGPLGLISAIPASTIEANRDKYESDSPDEMYWSQVRKFARFPQGIPEGININKIRPKNF